MSEIAQSKDKEKRALMISLARLEKRVPMELFKKMLFRSKILHSLAFFQWRYNNVSGANVNQIDTIFEVKKKFFKDSICLLPVDSLQPKGMVEIKKDKKRKDSQE